MESKTFLYECKKRLGTKHIQFYNVVEIKLSFLVYVSIFLK